MTHRRCPWRLAALLLLLTACPRESWSSQQATKEASFENRLGKFRIKLTASEVTTGVYGATTQVLYSVYRNGDFLHPATLEGGRVFGAAGIPPKEVVLRTLGDPEYEVGWLIGVCGWWGNTFSYYVALVVPSKESVWRHRTTGYMSKDLPVVITKPGETQVWSCYQEWAGGGTATSFYVPEMRVVRVTPAGQASVAIGRLPPDIDAWPNREWLSFPGIFVAGAANLNPELMQAAVKRWPDAIDSLRDYGLPGSKEGVMKLIVEVRRTRRLLAQFRHMKLDWRGTFDGDVGTEAVRELLRSAPKGND